MSVLTRLAPPSIQGYQASWLSRDVVAGITLPRSRSRSAWATPRFPRRRSSLACTASSFPPSSSRCWARPGSWWWVRTRRRLPSWRQGWRRSASLVFRRTRPSGWPGPAWSRWSALVCWSWRGCSGWGFFGDFLSASVLIGFLTGVGIQVFAGQIPDMLGIPKGKGTGSSSSGRRSRRWATPAAGPSPSRSEQLGIILGFKRFDTEGSGRRRGGDPLDHPLEYSRRLLAWCGCARLGTGRLPADRFA